MNAKWKIRCELAAIAALGALCLPSTVFAAERLTLSNGFDVVCDHHQLVDGHVRVFLKATEPDYFELKPEAVTGVESVPDPPAETRAAESSLPVAQASSLSSGQQHAKASDTKLTPEDLHQLLSKAGGEHNVDADLLASVVKAESGGNTHATSRAGARGLMQLMPGTALQLGVSDSFAPEQNVRGGTAYLDNLLTRYHDNITLALAAYNAGPEAVDRYHGIPPYRETRVYVARVVHEFNRRVAARQKSARQSLAAATIEIH
ncbi:lytic transglycosylase domain-containing protein [Acidicapsa ligni]|uniref:lytic transglycosylase domain-containing protein n=1 Tax=Acidicapsa ligni TaxID=542300 RepID=UPI0021E00D1D|nr:lytic transglycosylase domain-containing protein [Acidicapsa ligni]